MNNEKTVTNNNESEMIENLLEGNERRKKYLAYFLNLMYYDGEKKQLTGKEIKENLNKFIDDIDKFLTKMENGGVFALMVVSKIIKDPDNIQQNLFDMGIDLESFRK